MSHQKVTITLALAICILNVQNNADTVNEKIITTEEVEPVESKENISDKSNTAIVATVVKLDSAAHPEKNILDVHNSKKNITVEEVEPPDQSEQKVSDKPYLWKKLTVPLEPPNHPKKNVSDKPNLWKKLTVEELESSNHPEKYVPDKPNLWKMLTVEEPEPSNHPVENIPAKTNLWKKLTVEELEPPNQHEENLSDKAKRERKLILEELEPPEQPEENISDKPKSERKLTVEEIKPPDRPVENVPNKPKSGRKFTVQKLEPEVDSDNNEGGIMVEEVEPPIQPEEIKRFCHEWDSRDSVLPVIDDNFEPPERSIYFHETSCEADLNSRQACAIESAAKQNPHWQIHVFFSSPVSKQAMSNGSFPTLKNISNVHFHSLRLSDYVKGTPLYKVLENKTLPDTADAAILPCLTMYKYGGIYLDLDVVVVKPLGFLEWNFASFDHLYLASSVLAFSRNKAGRETAAEAISILAYDIATNGPEAEPKLPSIISRILTKRCNTTDVHKMNVATCDGFQVYDSKHFYPFSSEQGSQYFEKVHIDSDDVFVHHIASESTKEYEVYADSPYYTLGSRFCPEIFNLYKERFGNW